MSFLNRVAKAERDYYSGASFAFFGVIVIAFGILALIVNNKRLDFPETNAEVTGVVYCGWTGIRNNHRSAA